MPAIVSTSDIPTSFVFTSRNGCCPECIAFGRKWFIQDRPYYGNTYEYCLMSVTLDAQPTYCFKDKKELADWLNGPFTFRKNEDFWTDFCISRWTKVDYNDVALIEKDGIQYRYDKEKITLTVIPERRQESCWYDKYRECLADAKEHLQQEARKRGAMI